MDQPKGLRFPVNGLVSALRLSHKIAIRKLYMMFSQSIVQLRLSQSMNDNITSLCF
jgi:hypothetical protein